MSQKWVLIFMVIFAGVWAENDTIHEDAQLDMVGMLTKYGYPSEVHYVKTDDGYILKMYRIPYGVKCGADQVRKDPVIVMHGLLSNSIDFVLAGVDNGLGYILADDCYDVWLSNSRGNFESRNHTFINPDFSQFWQFSWHEMGQHDLPAVIEHVLTSTGKEQVHYIGHSQGTTQFFIYASLYPEESAKKVKSMHALAPVAFMENMTSPMLQWAAKNLDALETLLNVLGWDEFLPESDLIAQLGGNGCNDEHPNMQDMCENLLFILCGFDREESNATLLPIISAHDPAGASTRQVLHYGQEIKSAEFRQYDFGPMENLEHYGSSTPPKYEIEKIRVPLYLHYGLNDWMASVLDVERFAALTPTSILLPVPLPKFSHLDFLWAIHVREFLYDPILGYLNSS